MVFSLSKRLSHRFSVLASYAYSQTIGNYPGTYSATHGELNPNKSAQYDLTEFLVNRCGPLPNDRPHNFKATGFFEQSIGGKVKLTCGFTFTAISGRPIEVLGAHLFGGASEVFILPRRSGGRTPTGTQLDLHVGYKHQDSSHVRLALSFDIINLLDQRQIISVDDNYTYDPVSPLAYGRPADLRHLRAVFGTVVSLNSNYGQPTAFQDPTYFRAGGRLSF